MANSESSDDELDLSLSDLCEHVRNHEEVTYKRLVALKDRIEALENQLAGVSTSVTSLVNAGLSTGTLLRSGKQQPPRHHSSLDTARS